VRALAVDHTLEAVVEPALAAADMEGRRERAATWEAMARPTPNPAALPRAPHSVHGSNPGLCSPLGPQALHGQAPSEPPGAEEGSRAQV
jgi:hypothetical protein